MLKQAIQGSYCCLLGAKLYKIKIYRLQVAKQRNKIRMGKSEGIYKGTWRHFPEEHNLVSRFILACRTVMICKTRRHL